VACVSTPVSWLRLEQYAIGELAARDAAAVEDHVAGCPACRGCLDEIEGADIELAALPVSATRRAPDRPWQRWLAWGGGGALVAAAAAVLLVVLIGRGDGADAGSVPGQRVAIKGGDLAIELVRESGGAVAYDSATFVSGDRFEVRVTCPPRGGDSEIEVVIDQGGERFFPIDRAAIRCGNRVALPGAFRLTGERPATVCVVLRPGDRGELGRRGIDELGDAACVTVRPGR
jgi:hypothetical protein